MPSVPRPRRRAPLLAALLAAGLVTATAGCGTSEEVNAGPLGTGTDTPSVSTTLSSQTPSPSGAPLPGTESPTASDGASPSESQQQGGSGITTITVTVKGNKVTPPPSQVDISDGTPVRLVVTSDVDNELHVHLAEITRTLKAGQATTVEFVPEQAGSYAIELHDPELQLLKLVVR